MKGISIERSKMDRRASVLVWRRVSWGVLLLGVLCLGLASCRFQGPCVQECLARHEACVTRATTPSGLESCDAWLTRCQRTCR